MMCKKMMAVNYLPNLNLDSCINLYANQYLFPEIDETQQWCTPSRAATLLGLQDALFGQTMSVVLLLLSASFSFIL